MATLVGCVSCGKKVKKKEVILGRAKRLDDCRCVCPECLPHYKDGLPQATRPRCLCRVAVAAILLGLAGVLLLTWWALDSRRDKAAVQSSQYEDMVRELEAAGSRIVAVTERLLDGEPKSLDELEEMGDVLEQAATDAAGSLDYLPAQDLDKLAPQDRKRLEELLARTRQLREDYLRVQQLRLDDDSIEDFEQGLTREERTRMEKFLNASKRHRDAYRRLQRQMEDLERGSQ